MGHIQTHAVQQATTTVALFLCNRDRARLCGHCKGSRVRRRDFIAGLGAVWPLTTWRRQHGCRSSLVLLRSARDELKLGPGGKVIAAGMIGNVLEWYDFSVYGYFASSIGLNFFPRQDRVAQLLAAFAVFALGYLVRPIGGALIGHVGDHYGRRAALTVSVTAMAVPTFLVGLLPGYATLGLLAPVLLVLLRMVQGLSVGGEYTSSMVFLVERAAAGRRGLAGAIAACGSGVGTLLGSGVGATIAGLMTTETLEAWGWRIPFLLGLVVGVMGFRACGRRRSIRRGPSCLLSNISSRATIRCQKIEVFSRGNVAALSLDLSLNIRTVL